MSRLLRASVVAFVALQPLVALASPTPSPALSGVLAAPPTSDFVALDATTPGIFAGPFDAKGFVAISGTPDPTGDQKTMAQDGFLSGFGRTWVQGSTNHAMVEAVLAFNGGEGATKWMRQSEAADKRLSGYKNSITVSGIPVYYGAHLYDSKAVLYTDGIVLVKGNDAFLVIFVSGKDDLGNAASTQAKKQYGAAPALTIPQSQWPESATNLASSVGTVVRDALIGIVILTVVFAAVGLIVRSRRRPALQAVPVQAGPALEQPVPSAAVQMSEDRRTWWDGMTWRDAEHEVPPAAQRSSDGNFWWDGVTWRAVP